MTVLLFIFTGLLGLVFGSFLNVCISRLPQHQSIVAPRSRCPRCLTPIRSWDNIPVLSWILLRGRCRDCGERISVRYPLIEIATAALFLLCLIHFRETPIRAVGPAVLCWLLLALAATDAETMLLPDALTLPGIALGILNSSFLGFFGDLPWFEWRPALMSILWAVCAAAVILVIRALYWLVRRREGIGLGDAKLLAMIAAWLGPRQTGLVLFLGVVSAALYGLALIAVHGRRLRKAPLKSRPVEGHGFSHAVDGADSRRALAPEAPWQSLPKEGTGVAARIPLGSFLCAAALVALFEGNVILSWYLGFFR